jgi:hypothetical protein
MQLLKQPELHVACSAAQGLAHRRKVRLCATQCWSVPNTQAIRRTMRRRNRNSRICFAALTCEVGEAQSSTPVLPQDIWLLDGLSMLTTEAVCNETALALGRMARVV